MIRLSALNADSAEEKEEIVHPKEVSLKLL